MERVENLEAVREALARQTELARATAELSGASFGGFNHGCMPSAVGGPMSFCKTANTMLPVGDHKMPFQELTAPDQWKPGLAGFDPNFLVGNGNDRQLAGALKKSKRSGAGQALKGAQDAETIGARNAVLEAAGKCEDLYAKPSTQNQASLLEKC